MSQKKKYHLSLQNDEEDEDADYEDEETADDDQSDDSDNTMFERDCDLIEIITDTNAEVALGQASLKILYDEDVYVSFFRDWSRKETSLQVSCFFVGCTYYCQPNHRDEWRGE